MKKRILSMLLALCMVAMLLPTMAFAAEGTSPSEFLAQADANGVITLTDDVTLTGTVIINDGESYRVESDGPVTITSTCDPVFQVSGGSLTLGANLTIVGVDTGKTVLYVTGGTAEIAGAILRASSNNNATVLVTVDPRFNTSSLTVSSGTIEAKAAPDYDDGDFALLVENGATAEIHGGKITSCGDNTIAVGKNSKVDIYGGTIQSLGGNPYVPVYANGAGVIINISGNPTVENVGSNGSVYAKEGTITVTGGTYSHDPDKNDYVPKTHKAVKGNGTWTVKPAYTVSVTQPTDNSGTVSVDMTTAAEGDTVTVTATPAENYELDKITVTPANSSIAAPTVTNNSFTMPAGDVTVTATFVEKAAVPPPTGGGSYYQPVVTPTPSTPSEGEGTEGEGSGEGAVTETETVTNPDGSTTTTETVTETTTESSTAADGSTVTTETETVTETATTEAADGTTSTVITSTETVTETVEGADGSTETVETVTTVVTDEAGNVLGAAVEVTTTTETADGSTATTVESSDGSVSAEVVISEEAVEAALEAGEPVELPIPTVGAGSDVASAPVISVELPEGVEEAVVEIPVAAADEGTVIIVIDEDGNETILTDSVPTEDGVQATIPAGSTVVVVDNAKDFEDVSGWAQAAIDFVSARGIMTGTGDTSFDPTAPTTRAMVMTMLARLDGHDTTPGEDEAWYDQGLAWAIANGISDGSDLHGDVTREQLAVMLWRYAGEPASEHDISEYPDAGEVSDWAAAAMAWANEVGIIKGSDGSLLPGDDAQRDHVAQMMTNFIILMSK